MPHATPAVVVIVYSIGLIQPAEFRAKRSVRSMEFPWALVTCVGVRVRGTLEGHAGFDQRLGPEWMLFNSREAVAGYEALGANAQVLQRVTESP